jgi:hypothetical protein
MSFFGGGSVFAACVACPVCPMLGVVMQMSHASTANRRTSHIFKRTSRMTAMVSAKNDCRKD